jgi:hypothetical protein
MNWSIVVGVIFGAASLYFLAYGALLANRKDNQKTTDTVRTEIGKFSAQIATVQQSVSVQPSGVAATGQTGTPSLNTASQRDAQKELTDIEGNFSQWASNYIKDRDLKRLGVERQRLESRGNEIGVSKRIQPIFQRAIDAIRAAINAYNAKAGSNFKTDLQDIPPNLYSDPAPVQLGTVTFTPETQWIVQYYAEKPAALDRPPYLYIDIKTEHFRQGEDQIRIYPRENNLAITTFGGGIVSASKLAPNYPIATLNESVDTIVRQLVETQISSLPPEGKQ